MASPATKIDADLLNFIRAAAEVPYDQLGAHAIKEGWIWRLQQMDAFPTSFGTFAVTFGVLIGRADAPEKMAYFDAITVQIPAANLPLISVMARLAAEASIVPVVFNRIPPHIQRDMDRALAASKRPPPAAPTGGLVEPRPSPNGFDGAREVPMADRDTVLDEPLPAVDVVSSRARDGTPIFIDLYDLDEKIPKEAIIAAVFREIDDFLKIAESPESLIEFYKRNAVVEEFLTDLGTKDDHKKLETMFNAADARLTAGAAPPAPTPRRRRALATN